MQFSFEPNGRFRRDEPLARHSSFKIGGKAQYFAEPLTRSDLSFLIDFAETQGMPWILIGNASNILFSDEGFDGLVISLKKFESQRVRIDGPLVRASAGVGLIQLAYSLAEHSLSGVEFVSTIPGTVGGGLVMNAGYSRKSGQINQLSDWVREVTVLGPDGMPLVLNRDEIDFNYRSSSLAGQIVIEAVFNLKPAPREEILRELKANTEYRSSVHPLNLPSAGSVFKNPKNSGFTAGQMIDRAGLRGRRIGGAEISEKHGNFIVNIGQARAKDVLELIEIAKVSVRKKFGVDLELEVKYISSEAPLSV